MALVTAALMPTPAAGGSDPRSATIEALALLQVLLRQDTTLPSESEIRAARVLAVFFSDKGIGCELVEPEPRRGNLLCEVKGDGSGRPILVVAPLDVAPAGGAGGGELPGSGRLRDNRICGRGVLGGKGMAAATAEAMALLERQGPLARGILFLGAADGEAAGDLGLKWLLEHRPELSQVEAALTGGGRLVEAGGNLVAAVQVEGAIGEQPLPQALRRALARLAPDARVEAATEPAPAGLKLLRQRGIQAYGLVPFPVEGVGIDPRRGEEECLSLDGFELGVRLMAALLREAASR